MAQGLAGTLYGQEIQPHHVAPEGSSAVSRRLCLLCAWRSQSGGLGGVRPPCRPGVHFHCCVIEGVFVAGADGQVQSTEAAALRPEGLAAVLRWFARAGHLDAADARDMASWDRGGGFALDASGRIEGPDRAGLTAAAALLRRPALRAGAPRAGQRR
jgi:hypothetical protein